MARHNISEAARMVDKDRKTLYRHIKKGELSKQTDEEGNPYIETSELIRVYGEVGSPQPDTEGQGDNAPQDDTPERTPSAAHEIELLQLKLEHAEQRRQEAERREDAARAEVARLLGIVEKQTLLLNPPKEDAAAEAEPEPAKPQQPPQRPGFFRRVFGGDD